MSANETSAQLQMVWPEHLLRSPPAVRLPPGYALRAYRRGDEPRFYNIMELAGWPGWNDERLKPWMARILPDGRFAAVLCIFEPSYLRDKRTTQPYFKGIEANELLTPDS